MVGTVLIITVLNCFFMFSTTVSTCALWWQNKRYRCRYCGQHHTKDKSDNDSKKKKKKKKKKEKHIKSDDESDSYMQCADAMNFCYENNGDSSMPNRYSCVREQKSFQQESEMNGMQQHQEDIIIANKNGATPQPAVTSPDNINNVHGVRTNNANESKNDEPENVDKQDTEPPQIPRNNGDSIPVEEVARKSAQRNSLERPPSLNAESTAATKSLKNPKFTQCINSHINSPLPPNTVRCKVPNLRNGIKCCGPN